MFTPILAYDPATGRIFVSQQWGDPVNTGQPKIHVYRVTGVGTPSPTPDTTAPSTPSNLFASAISASQINLSWAASTDNVGVTGYRVERCLGSSCTNFVQIGTPSGTSYSDSGLTANTVYRYRVRATDLAGNPSTYSSIVSATTQAATGTLPTRLLHQGHLIHQRSFTIPDMQDIGVPGGAPQYCAYTNAAIPYNPPNNSLFFV